MGRLRPSSPSGGIAVATVEHVEQSIALVTEALYRRHAERVWRYCLHFLRRPADAEDALQQTFLQAHRALARGVEPEAEAAWLLAIARNVCLTRADTQRRRGRAEVAEDPRLLEVAASDGRDEGVSEDVQAALARLPERQRRALFLREWQECSYAEIAAALGTSESAIETLLFRARRTLARELGASRTRRRNGDLAGLLGWVRIGLAPAASKVGIGVGVAVVAVALAGKDVATHGDRSGAVNVRPAVVAQRPALVAPHHPTPVRATAWPHRADVRVHEHAARAPAPPPGRPPTPAPVRGAAPRPVERTVAPSSNAAPAPSAPALPPVVETPATAAANVVDGTTNAVSSTVDTVAQTASTVVPAAAPAVTTVAQTVSGAGSTVDSTAQTVTSTVSNLLPGR